MTGDCTIFSHEQCIGPKNASAIVEEILIDHCIRCVGESVNTVVSDNASVRKNWLTTVALLQYISDQGLADVVLIIFMENNHRKWLAGMLYGKFSNIKKAQNAIKY